MLIGSDTIEVKRMGSDESPGKCLLTIFSQVCYTL